MNDQALVPSWQCTAMSGRNKRRCRRARMLGQKVCATHGGKSPQAMRSARERLNAMALDAVEGLYVALRSDNESAIVAAANAVLDRVPGFARNAKLEVTSGADSVADWAPYLTDDELGTLQRLIASAKERMANDARDGALDDEPAPAPVVLDAEVLDAAEV
jgi:hypothetical protein